MKMFAEVAADEFPLDFPDVRAPLCRASIELTDAELAELVRLPWNSGRLRLDIGPEPILQCSHEHGHPGQHIAFGAESGKLTVWVAWDGQRSHIFPADYCRRKSSSGGMCVLNDGHTGRHAIGRG
ncbi:hypothetical protein GCM10010191_88720 [Actinomadura vinacea]|uniref:Uncharacterized protein n=1 Tax=Actinomadura vinacea TaxID=115336 RepID=A0ABP5XKZ1_9ACTN